MKKPEELVDAILEVRARLRAMSESRGRIAGMEPQKPSVGRVVHLKQADGTVHAAIVTHVFSDECVNLAAFYPSGSPYSATSVLRGGDAGRWDWPARV